MGLFGRSKWHTKGNFEEKKDKEWPNSKEEKIRLNLLEHLTGENFHNVALFLPCFKFFNYDIFDTNCKLRNTNRPEIIIIHEPFHRFRASFQSSAIDYKWHSDTSRN